MFCFRRALLKRIHGIAFVEKSSISRMRDTDLPDDTLKFNWNMRPLGSSTVRSSEHRLKVGHKFTTLVTVEACLDGDGFVGGIDHIGLKQVDWSVLDTTKSIGLHEFQPPHLATLPHDRDDSQ